MTPTTFQLEAPEVITPVAVEAARDAVDILTPTAPRS